MAITNFGKVLIVGLVVAGGFGLVTTLKNKGLIFNKAAGKSQVVGTIDLPTAPPNAKETVPSLANPSEEPAGVTGPQMRMLVWAWNAQMGLMYANGGKEPAKGSLMEKNGVNLRLERQDDVSQMQASLVKFATEYSKNPSTTDGAQAVAIMGDGAAAFLAGVNPQLEKIGPEYRAEIVASQGFSYGEDAFMGLPEWRANPQKAKGSLIAAYLRDGDWNIVVKWAGDNAIAVNPDETTWDAEAVNFVNPTDYIDAANKYIAGYCEDRAVVVSGVKTGEKKRVCVNGVATWTPGDVLVAENKGGLVKIASTKEYASQMPNVVIVIRKWAEDNRKTMLGFIKAVTDGSDQVKCYSSALEYAGKVSATVYGEKDGSYWVKYYKGITEPDKQGLMIELGGSKVNNLADNLTLFGLANGSTNTLKIVYNTFGGIVSKLYPSSVPTFPHADSVINVSYLRELMNTAPAGKIASADVQTYSSSYAISQKVSEKGWSIEFLSGKATLTPKAMKTLDSIATQAVVASGLRIELTGHTDNVGDPAMNQTLSEARANAVKAWLQSNYGASFPNSRVTVSGKGDTNPIASNETEAGKAKNRRVVVVMGK